MEKNFCTKIVHSSATGAFATLAYLALAGAVTPSLAAEGKLDTAKIEQLTSVKGEPSEKEGVIYGQSSSHGPSGYHSRSEDESGYGLDLIRSLYESRCQNNGYG